MPAPVPLRASVLVRAMVSILVLMAAQALVPATAAAAPAAARPEPHAVPDTMAQRLQACTVCHGADGRATAQGYFPRLAGKPAGYLYQQLVHFREGRRSNPTMTRLLRNLSDDYLRDIAGHFAGQQLPYPPPQTRAADPAEMARGEALVRRGDPTRRLPACEQCHGPALTGVQPALPGLLGLPRDYLVAQLGAWQTGQRRAAAPDCMAHVARQLAAADIAAVATWLSSQAVPGTAVPAITIARPLPLDCGTDAH